MSQYMIQQGTINVVLNVHPSHLCITTGYSNFTFMLPCIVIDFFLNNQPDVLIIQILFCYKTLYVSDIFSARHQGFSAVHSALVSFMQVLMTASKQSQDGTCRMDSRKLLMMGREDA
jgi:hypothetical protein